MNCCLNVATATEATVPLQPRQQSTWCGRRISDLTGSPSRTLLLIAMPGLIALVEGAITLFECSRSECSEDRTMQAGIVVAAGTAVFTLGCVLFLAGIRPNNNSRAPEDLQLSQV